MSVPHSYMFVCADVCSCVCVCVCVWFDIYIGIYLILTLILTWFSTSPSPSTDQTPLHRQSSCGQQSFSLSLSYLPFLNGDSAAKICGQRWAAIKTDNQAVRLPARGRRCTSTLLSCSWSQIIIWTISGRSLLPVSVWGCNPRLRDAGCSACGIYILQAHLVSF